jgi:CubicO group peptidase (beta-lactamase class C family)
VDQKKVALDAPLTRYIKTFTMASPMYRKMTVRELLNHSSGFPGTDYRNAETFSPFTGYAAQVLSTLANARLKHKPGFMSVYCNDGFTVTEQLISSVTGKEYTQFVQDEILTPLGMAHSRYTLSDFPYGSYAQRYIGSTRLPQLFMNAFASGGLYSTPTDMAKIAIMMINGGKIGGTRFLSRASVEAMGIDQTSGRFNPVKSYTWSYGLGLDSVHQPGLRAVHVTAWHKGGDVTLYGSAIIVAPKEGLSAIVMGSSGNFNSDRATIIAERILLRALAEKGRIAAMPEPLNPKPLPLRRSSATFLSSVQGHYGNNDAAFRVEPQLDKSLNIMKWDTNTNTWANYKTRLRLRSDGRFASDTDPGTAYSFKTAQGRQYLITRTIKGYGHYQDDEVFAQKIVASSDLPHSWANRSGRKWLMVNEHPDAVMWTTPFAQLMAVDNLLFVQTGGVQALDPFLGDSLAGMMLVIPQMDGRDLNDLVIETREGEEWVRFGSYLYRPRETIKALKTDGDTIELGAEGLAEWRTLTLDAAKTMSVVTNGAWKGFTSNLVLNCTAVGTKSLTIPAGSYYLLFHSNASISFQ